MARLDGIRDNIVGGLQTNAENSQEQSNNYERGILLLIFIRQLCKDKLHFADVCCSWIEEGGESYIMFP